MQESRAGLPKALPTPTMEPYLLKEVAAKRMWGPFPAAPFPAIRQCDHGLANMDERHYQLQSLKAQMARLSSQMTALQIRVEHLTVEDLPPVLSCANTQERSSSIRAKTREGLPHQHPATQSEDNPNQSRHEHPVKQPDSDSQPGASQTPVPGRQTETVYICSAAKKAAYHAQGCSCYTKAAKRQPMSIKTARAHGHVSCRHSTCRHLALLP